MLPRLPAGGRLGKVCRSLGNPKQSRLYTLKAEQLHREKYKQDTQTTASIEGLSFVPSDLGQMYERTGDTEKMLAASREAMPLADRLASEPNKLMSSGNAACGYAFVSRHLADDDPKSLPRQSL